MSGESMRQPLDRSVSLRPVTRGNGSVYFNANKSNTPRFNGRLKERLIMSDKPNTNDESDSRYTIPSTASFV